MRCVSGFGRPKYILQILVSSTPLGICFVDESQTEDRNEGFSEQSFQNLRYSCLVWSLGTSLS